MRRNTFWSRGVLFILTFAAVSILSVFLWISKGFIWSNIYATISNIAVLASICVALFQRRGKLYLFITKYWVIITNQSATWNCSAHYEGEFDSSILRVCKDIFSHNDKVRVIKDTSQHLELFFDGMLIECDFAEDSDEAGNVRGDLTTIVRDFHAAYDKTEEVLGDRVVPFFEQIKDAINNKSEESYCFRIRFDNGRNPFITATLQNSNKKKLSGFQCDFYVEEPLMQSPTFINISKSMLSITTPSLRRFHELSSNYLGVMGE